MNPAYIFCPLIVIIAAYLVPSRLRTCTAFMLATIYFLFHLATTLNPHLLIITLPDIVQRLFSSEFSVDALSRVMLLSIGIVGMSVLWMAVGLNGMPRLNFIVLLMAAVIGANGVVMVHDIFSLYVFLELTAIASFLLIAFDRQALSLEGSFKYLLMSALATICILTAIALFFLVSGGTSFSSLTSLFVSQPHEFLIQCAVMLLVCGLFIKAGVMPFHWWVPDAYSAAPAVSSVFLAGIVTKIAGVYTLMRIVVFIIGVHQSLSAICMTVGIISIVGAALAAIGQNDFRRMLAYSSISQVGYILVGMATGTPLGIAGAAFHFLNHSVFKSLLFLNSAAVERQAGTRDMDAVSGLSNRMPVTGMTSVIGLLSTCGIPPLAGFWSKLLIIMALWLAGYHTYAVIAVLASVLTMTYLLGMQRRVFFGEISEKFRNIKEAGLDITVPSLALAILSLGMGLFFAVVYNNLIAPVQMMIR